MRDSLSAGQGVVPEEDPSSHARTRSGRWLFNWVAAALVFIPSFATGSSPDSLRWRISQLVGELSWSVVDWEVRHGLAGARLVLAQAGGPLNPEEVDREVARYLGDGSLEATPVPEPAVLASAVAGYLHDQGVATIAGLVFPPVAFAITEPPLVLVVSPRSEIRLRYALPLDSEATLETVEDLERQVERLDVSALVAQTGGIATYPTLIPPDTPPLRLIETIGHEWTHTALFFSPLGRAYGTSPEARALNETAADIVGAEVAARFAPPGSGEPIAVPPEGRGAFLRDRLRAIRLRADELLANGDIVGAEAFMEAERQGLVERGYRIRRLNQAYFAFHGSYAEGPAASTEIPDGLRLLRARSTSLGEFISRVGQIISVADLRSALRASSPAR